MVISLNSKYRDTNLRICSQYIEGLCDQCASSILLAYSTLYKKPITQYGNSGNFRINGRVRLFLCQAPFIFRLADVQPLYVVHGELSSFALLLQQNKAAQYLPYIMNERRNIVIFELAVSPISTPPTCNFHAPRRCNSQKLQNVAKGT